MVFFNGLPTKPMHTRPMNRILSLLVITSALGLGAVGGHFYGQTKQSLPSNVNAQTFASAHTIDAAYQHPYDPARARTESEKNTVSIVKERRDGLVYIHTENNPEEGVQGLEGVFGSSKEATGSGFFVTKNGDIITNNHVVEGAKKITIRLHGSKKIYTASVVGRAPEFDIALIRAEGLPKEAIQPMPLGDSDQLDVGLKAIAMGAPFNLDFSVSEGIISSLERTADIGSRGISQAVIQTDAAINPGNSGGPLLSSTGEVIGVNTQIATGGIGQSAGVGFAVPINTVKKLIPQLQKSQGKALATPALGIQFTDLSTLDKATRTEHHLPETGLLVSKVYQGSPAEKAGLRGLEVTDEDDSTNNTTHDINTKKADIITAVDGQPISEGDDLRRSVIGKKVGDTLSLTLSRQGRERIVKVPLSAFTLPQ